MDELTRIGNELKRSGFRLEPITEIKSNEDYSQMIGNSVYSICELFYNQGHSGASAQFALQMLEKLLIKGTSLSPLTNNPNEWEDVSKQSNQPLFQSKRDFNCFTTDMKYYYNINDEGKTLMYRKLVEV